MRVTQIARTVVALAILVSSGCSTIEEKPVNAAPSTQPNKVLHLNEANTLVQSYLTKNNLSWGEPEFIRNAPGKIIYSYKTPEKETNTHGPRIIVVNIHSREITIPEINGRKFSSRK